MIAAIHDQDLVVPKPKGGSLCSLKRQLAHFAGKRYGFTTCGEGEATFQIMPPLVRSPSGKGLASALHDYYQVAACSSVSIDLMKPSCSSEIPFTSTSTSKKTRFSRTRKEACC